MFIFFYIISIFGFAGCNEKEVETKTTELCNFLDMLRSASGDNGGGSSSTSHTDWKVSYIMFCFLDISIAYLDHHPLT